MVGRQIDQYEVLEKLGEGGMGAVYKAHDRRLERLVAIKVLSPRLTEQPSPVDTARLDKEARAVSALNHPHIATIHDRGEFEGQPYLVFEYLSGGTLRDQLRLYDGRGLPLPELLRYAIQAADGLAHAHRRGVVHRDIKTDNMMLTEEGSLKITDFGLALRGAGRDTGGREGLGTAAYMSPEQGQGLDVDHRSDIFSFGVMLFELATGRTPFRGPHPAAIAYDIIHTPTPDPAPLRPDLPNGLREIILRTTEKDPDRRYADTTDLLADLRALEDDLVTGRTAAYYSGPVRTPPRSKRLVWSMVAAGGLMLALLTWLGGGALIERDADASLTLAVLPLENLSRDPAQDYLADGLTESLITDLARLPSLRVISRTAVLRYRNSGLSVREIGRELGADRIVEGTVLQVGEQIRISAQLINPANEQHMWAEAYQYPAQDVLALQQEVARAVAREVQLNVAAPQQLPSRRVRSVNPEAYAAYVRGRLSSFEWTLPGITRAINEFERALEIDPAYAEAHAGLAIAYGFLGFQNAASAGELWPKARAAAERALALDPELDQAYVALGFVEAVFDWNWSGAERNLRRALELNPGSVDARHALAMTVLAPQGRLDEARTMLEDAVRLDPLSASLISNLADVAAFQGHYKEALALYERSLKVDPNLPAALIWRGLTLYWLDRRSEAAETWNAAYQIEGGRLPAVRALAMIAEGRRQEARAEIDAARQRSEEANRGPWCLYAMAYALSGDKPDAIAALERAFAERNSNLLMLKVSPAYDALRDEERFHAILQGMTLE